MPTWRRQCLECGTEFKTTRLDRMFCGQGCRLRFNNRRMLRYLALGDLFMEMRFERDKAKKQKCWSHMCMMASRFRDEDTRDRAGRKSWASTDRLVDVAHSRLGR